MTVKTKFEQLIEYVINDEEQKAHELFHDIVVEKSREIYENIMNEEDEEEQEEELDEGSMSDSTGRAQEDLMKEVETDQEGAMNEEEGDAEDDADAEMDDEAEEASEEETADTEADAEEAGAEGGIEDRVVDLEDKLDELMAEFEALMGDEEVAGGDEFDMEPVDGDVGGDAEMGDDTAEFTDVEVPMTEAVSLIKVAAAKMGDDGVQTKSPTRFNSGAAGMQGKPVKASGATESNPDGTAAYKAPTSYADKGRGDVKGAGNFKNVPGKSSSPKLEAAPKPTSSQASGSNTRTPFPKG